MVSDKEEHKNINIILSFCKHCGEDYAGLVPRSIRILSDKFGIPVPNNTTLPVEKQRNVKLLLKDYYTSLTKHLMKEHSEIQMYERQSKRILQTKGELSAERKEKSENMAASFQRLLVGTQSFAEILDEDVPDLPEDTSPQSTDLSVCMSELEDGSHVFNVWEDEETHHFYRVFPNLNDFLPSLKLTKDSSPTESIVPVVTEEKLDEEIIEDDLKDDGEKVDEPVIIEVEEPEEPDTTVNPGAKVMLDAFFHHLPNCVNCELIDNAAIEFLMNHNTKNNRKKLVKTLFGVARTRLDLLPFYARLVAILNPVMPEVAIDLGLLLKHDFRYHVRKKDQINIESKIKVVRFIGEMVKFELYSKIEGLYCLKVLLHDFSHHHIEMACNLLETCGRYLFRNIDTHQRTKVYLEQMMRKKSVIALDWRYITMVENAFYHVSPPESQASVTKERPPLHRFIRHILYQQLMKPGPESEALVLNLMRKLEWDKKEVAAYAIKCLTNASNVKYYNIQCLANLLAGLVDFQEFIGAHVVDGVLEDIRWGMEVNHLKLNQRRVAMIKYLGELYNYRMVESSDIFKVLYSLISFGVTMSYDQISSIDPPDNLFRIRLVCVLLETCGHFFCHGPSKLKLDYFFIFFQNYYWFKYNDPVWTTENPFPVDVGFMFRDTLLSLRPHLKLIKSYDESKEAVLQLQQKLIEKNPLMLKNEDGGSGLDVIYEGSDEQEAEINELDEQLYGDEDDFENLYYDDYDDVEGENRGRRNRRIGADYLDDNGIGFISDGNETSDIEKSQGEKDEVDGDFVNAFERMVSDNITERMREQVKPPQVDIAVPFHVKSNAKKTYEQLQEPEVNHSSINFVLMLKKGNKQQYKTLAVPVDSEMAVNLRSQEKAKKVEMEKVKRLTLDINDRLEEEDYQDQMCQIQKPSTVNLNRERKHKYQHPKGAPDADLIFGKKKFQR
ncbi:regulator of nonsense transcripts 2 isoform X2 [Nilaparvata lugens]|nr:regulator of nonsense transcripts 2 isoform X2 [Nilaparvata lugens]